MGNLGQDVPPKVRRGGVTVLEYDRVPGALFHIGHLVPQDFYTLLVHGLTFEIWFTFFEESM